MCFNTFVSFATKSPTGKKMRLVKIPSVCNVELLEQTTSKCAMDVYAWNIFTHCTTINALIASQPTKLLKMQVNIVASYSATASKQTGPF